MSKDPYLDEFPAAEDQVQENKGAPPGDEAAEESRPQPIWVKISRAGLGERIYRIGTASLTVAMILLAVVGMRLFYVHFQHPSATPTQAGALAAYRMGIGYFEPVRREYERRRDVLYEGMKKIPGVVLQMPQGAFYMLVKLPIKDAEHFVTWMLNDFELDRQTVMVAPGPGFYATPGKGKDEVRIAYVLNCLDLDRAMKVLAAGVEAYNRK